MRDISLAALSLLGLSPPDVVHVASEAGFDSVGVRLAAVPGSVDHQMLGDSRTRRSTVRALRDTGLRVLDVEVCRLLPVGEEQPRVDSVFEAAAELCARQVVVITYDPDVNRAVEAFSELCRQAADYDMGCVLEFMGFTEAKTIEAAADIVERSAMANAGVLVDPLHLFRTGASACSLAALAPERLPFAQLCDARHANVSRIRRRREQRRSRIVCCPAREPCRCMRS
jgi:sugar phosphate isomerase/epimerase